jgi:hypothetical protein
MAFDNTTHPQHAHDRHEHKEHRLERHDEASREAVHDLNERSSVHTIRAMESADSRPSQAQCQDFALTDSGRVVAEHHGKNNHENKHDGKAHTDVANAPGAKGRPHESLDELTQKATQNPELAVKLADSNPALLSIMASQSPELERRLAASDPGLARDLANNDPVTAARLNLVIPNYGGSKYDSNQG